MVTRYSYIFFIGRKKGFVKFLSYLLINIIFFFFNSNMFDQNVIFLQLVYIYCYVK